MSISPDLQEIYTECRIEVGCRGLAADARRLFAFGFRAAVPDRGCGHHKDPPPPCQDSWSENDAMQLTLSYVKAWTLCRRA